MAWQIPERSEELGELLSAADPDPSNRPPTVFTGAPLPVGSVRSRLETLDIDVVSLSSPGLSKIVEYEPRDLVVTVGAGTRLKDLAGTLAERGQWLPVAVSRPEATVGGLAAAAPAGPLDPTFGSVRRHVLACRVVAHDGRQLRWGRPVVKNVAGYDVQGLWCGSRGRLGALIEVSLRVWPLPARDALFEVGPGPSSTSLLAAYFGIPAKSGFRPDGASWRWRGGSGEPPVLRFRLFGRSESVTERREMLGQWAMELGAEVREIEPDAGMDETEAPPAQPLDRVVVFVRAGRAALSDVTGRLVSSLGPSRAAVDAYPLDGVVRCEYDRNRGVSLQELADAAGRGELSIDRGGPDEHEFARNRRTGAIGDLERRVLDALGGRERHWIAEYL